MFRKKYNCNRCCCFRTMDKFDINLQQLNQMSQQGAIIIDIRSPQEYEEGHIVGAIVLPDYDIRRKINKVIPNKNQLVVVYCGTGIRSKRVQKHMQQMGYSNVYNLYKGTENY